MSKMDELIDKLECESVCHAQFHSQQCFEVQQDINKELLRIVKGLEEEVTLLRSRQDKRMRNEPIG